MGVAANIAIGYRRSPGHAYRVTRGQAELNAVITGAVAVARHFASVQRKVRYAEALDTAIAAARDVYVAQTDITDIVQRHANVRSASDCTAGPVTAAAAITSDRETAVSVLNENTVGCRTRRGHLCQGHPERCQSCWTVNVDRLAVSRIYGSRRTV